MPYCTTTDYINWRGEAELIQLTDREQLGTVDATVFGESQENAAALIDAQLAARYTLPLASVPLVLKQAALKIVRYELHGDAITDRIAKDYDDALALLRAIGRGDLSIGIDASGSSPAPTGGEAYIESGGHVFGRSDNAFI